MKRSLSADLSVTYLCIYIRHLPLRVIVDETSPQTTRQDQALNGKVSRRAIFSRCLGICDSSTVRSSAVLDGIGAVKQLVPIPFADAGGRVAPLLRIVAATLLGRLVW